MTGSSRVGGSPHDNGSMTVITTLLRRSATNRHRLIRGGDRQANAALHRIVVVRLRHDHRTKE